jgi:hypothetical protein
MKNDSAVVAETSQQASTTEEKVSTSSSSESTSVASSTAKKIPFSKFLTLGGAHTCTVNQTLASMTSTGTVFIHDSLVRANFTMNVTGATINSSVILRDGYVYSWTDKTLTKGIKMKAKDDSASSTVSSKIMPWNGEDIGDYTCSEWKVDDSVFILPKAVTFTEAK